MTLKAFDKVNISGRTHYTVKDANDNYIESFTVDYGKSNPDLNNGILKKLDYISRGAKVEYVTSLSGESGVALDVTLVVTK